MPLFNYLTLFAALANFILGLLVLLRSRRKIINISFAVFSFLTSIWILTNFFFLLKPTLFWMKSQYATGATVIPSFLVWFYFLLTSKPKRSRVILYYIIALFLLLVVYINGIIIKDLSIVAPGDYDLKLGPLFDIFSYLLLALFVYLYIKLIVAHKKASGTKRIQISYIMFGAGAFGGISMLFSFVLPFFKIVPVAAVDAQSSLFFVAFTTYAIVRHRLMDIRVIISRSIIYAFLVLFVAAMFTGITVLTGMLFEEVLGVNTFIVTLGVSILIVALLEPIKRWLSRETDKVFFQAKIEYPEVQRQLSEIVATEIEIDSLIEKVTKNLSQGLKINKSVLVLLRREGEYKTRTFNHPHTVPIKLEKENPIIKYFGKNDKVIITEELQRKIEDTTDEKVRKELEESMNELNKMNAGAVAPVKTKKRLNAILVLGPKLSGDVFNNDDIGLIEVLSPQIASAIEKARLYGEVKGFTKTLQKKVDDATKELSERNKFLLALQKVSNLITRSLDLSKVTQNIVDSIRNELGYIGGLLLFIDKEKDTIYPAAVTEAKITKKALKLLPKKMSEYSSILSKDRTLDAVAVKEGKIKIGRGFEEFISPPVPKAVCLAINKFLKIKTIVAVPIFSEDEVMGVIDFVLDKEENKISKREIEMMKSLADQTGIVARNLRLFEQIQKANEELAEANIHLKQLDQAKSEFVSIASHQLRTPMTGIMGYLSMLTTGDFGKLKPKHEKILKELLGESNRMIRLINQFLNVSKIEAGKFEMEEKKVQLESLIEEKINEIKHVAEKKKLKIIYNKPKSKLPVIFGDPDKLSDIILNLIDNAIKYTSKGSITVGINKKGKELLTSIRDSGVGIKKEDVNELFGKFQRGTGIARIQPDGSGLGLFIAKSVVEAHRGKIWVESEGEGKGSTFYFTIPIKK